MSIAGDKTKERQLENVLLGGRRRRPKENSQEIIQSAAKLSNAISTAARSVHQSAGTRGSKPSTGKLAQALALQRALVPDLAKKGRGRYKSNLRVPGKPSTGNIVKSTRGQNRQRTGTVRSPTQRPAMNGGGVTFHFRHTFVSKGNGKSTDSNAKRSGTASAHQKYIERQDAVERDEEGRPLVVGTIGETARERGEFWDKLEAIERSDGRVQCRIVLELPHELDGEQRHTLLRDFAKLFGERGLPYFGALHEPDEGTDERNYHAHLVYTDRPAKPVEGTTWDFEERETRQKKDLEARGPKWIQHLRNECARIANRHLETAGVEKRYDPRSYREAGLEKVPERHLGSTLAALEQQGYVSQEGLHNALVDKSYRERTVLERSRRDRLALRDALAPVRTILAEAGHFKEDAGVVQDAAELRRLALEFLQAERIALKQRREKALHVARKRAAMARSWQTKKWSERELEKIDASAMASGQLTVSAKKRRAGLVARKTEAEMVLAEVEQQYEPGWQRLLARDMAMESARAESKRLQGLIPAARRALELRIDGTKVTAEMTQRAENYRRPIEGATAPAAVISSAKPKTTPPIRVWTPFRVQIRATLPGLALTTSRDAARQKEPGVVDGASLMPLPSGPTFSPPEISTTLPPAMPSPGAQPNEKLLTPTPPIPGGEISTRNKRSFTFIQKPKLKR
jgi:hypothetical protein